MGVTIVSEPGKNKEAPKTRKEGTLSREEIAELPLWSATAMAVRCAARCQPLVAIALKDKPPFWFWKDEARNHLQKLDRAFTLAAASALRWEHHAAAAAAAAAAYATTAAAAAAAAYAAAGAAYAAADAAAYAADDPAATAAAAKAAEAAAYAEDDPATAEVAAYAAPSADAIRADYTFLQDHQADPATNAELFQQPLWADATPPAEWMQLVDRWERALGDLDPPLTHIAERYRRMCDGGGIDWSREDPELAAWVGDSPIGIPITQCERPSPVDTLGRQHLVDTLTAMLTHEQQETPLTIALLGEWGAGKSSVMLQLREAVQSQSRIGFAFAEFNAWKYEHCENMQAGLTQEVMNGLTKDYNHWRYWRLLWRFAWKEHPAPMWRSGLSIAGLAIGAGALGWAAKMGGMLQGSWFATTGGPAIAGAFLAALWQGLAPVVRAPVWRDMASYMKLPDYRKRLGDVPVMMRHIDTLCQLTEVDGKKKRLLVFVDDLDRCRPGAIVRLLDAVRLVMDREGVIVVIAIDSGVMMSAVTAKEHYAERGREYLGKIIQLPIHLEPPQPRRLKAFLRGLMPMIQTDEAPPPPSAADESSGPSDEPLDRTQPEPTPQSGPEPDDATQTPSAPPSHELIDPIEHTPEEADLFVALGETLGVNNPRRGKRLLATYRLLKTLHRLGGAGVEEAVEPVEIMAAIFLVDELLESTAGRKEAAAAAQSLHQQQKLSRDKLREAVGHERFETGNAALVEAGGRSIEDWGDAQWEQMLRLALSVMLPHAQLDQLPETPLALDSPIISHR